ncbi:MAG TPA: hypothetical protein VGM68_04030 [Rhizomicrobium sp.]
MAKFITGLVTGLIIGTFFTSYFSDSSLNNTTYTLRSKMERFVPGAN